MHQSRPNLRHPRPTRNGTSQAASPVIKLDNTAPRFRINRLPDTHPQGGPPFTLSPYEVLRPLRPAAPPPHHPSRPRPS
jgi:hypothetical protein